MSDGRRVDKDGVKVKEKNGDKKAGKMEPKKGERRLGEAGKRNGKEKEKIDKLPVPPVFDFLQSPFPTHKGKACVPAKSEKEDQSELGPGDIF